MALRIAIYGYDTDIGRLILEVLEERRFPVSELYPLSPLPGEYDAVTLDGRNYLIEYVDDFDFAKADLAFFITTPDETARLQQKARQSGCIVIDNSRLYSGSAEAAVILPELNPYAVNDALAQKLAVPASSVTTELALPLALLHDEFGVARVQAAVLEAVSEHGRSGTETLARETAHLLNGMPADNSDFPAQLAFNLHTSIGKTQEDGTTDHEAAVLFELSKIFGPMTKGISLTCLQAPVFYGHTAVVQVELEDDPSVEEVAECLRRSPDIELVTDELLTPVTHGVRENCIYLSRLRRSAGVKRTFDLVLVMDNTRRGEALNCVEIAELIDKALHS